ALDSFAANWQLLFAYRIFASERPCCCERVRRFFLKSLVRTSLDENFSAAAVHLVEQSNVWNATVDLALRRVRRRGRIWQSLLPDQERQDRSGAWYRPSLGDL